jgi:hypothetical protein
VTGAADPVSGVPPVPTGRRAPPPPPPPDPLCRYFPGNPRITVFCPWCLVVVPPAVGSRAGFVAPVKTSVQHPQGRLDARLRFSQWSDSRLSPVIEGNARPGGGLWRVMAGVWSGFCRCLRGLGSGVCAVGAIQAAVMVADRGFAVKWRVIELEDRFPHIEWRQPFWLVLPECEGHACRVCVAEYGLRASESQRVFDSVEGFERHFIAEHGALPASV